MRCQTALLCFISFVCFSPPTSPATSPTPAMESPQQKMDQDQATAAKLEALKDVYNDPPKGTVKTIITENGQVVDFVKIEEQPAFDHPLLKDHKIQMKPSSHPIEREPRPNENVVKPTIDFAEQIPEGTIPIFRSRKGDFRKTTGPGMVFLRPSNDQSAGTNTSSVNDANEK